MSNIYIISDLHLGHEKLALHRGFSSVEDHDHFIIEQWNSVVHNKKDLVYILGDITREDSSFYPYLDYLNGRKKVVMGNHDRPRHVEELLNYVDSVQSCYIKMIKDPSTGIGKKAILTHIPIHDSEMDRFMSNIHGHTHEKLIVDQSGNPDPRYINVCCEQLNYTPKLLYKCVW